MKRLVIGPGVVKWAAKQLHEYGDFGAAVGFGIEDDAGRLRAGVVFNDYNGVNMNIHVASDGSGTWMTRELLWTVFDYAFNQAKVNRITGLVGSKNEASIRFNVHLGFEHEATLEGAHPDGDMIVYRMWRKDCRWLNMKRPNHGLQKAA